MAHRHRRGSCHLEAISERRVHTTEDGAGEEAEDEFRLGTFELRENISLSEK
jgi:hypothetical protein